MDLSTTYLGLDLKCPIVPSASPLSESVSNIKKMEDAGAGAVVLHSLFEEQLTQSSLEIDHFLTLGSESHGEAASYFPHHDEYHVGPETYLHHIVEATSAVDIPIIASLNGVSSGGWTSFAKEIEAAGASALELNTYFIATDPELTGHEVERMYLEVVRDVTDAVSIPVAVKLNPFFSSLPYMCGQLVEAGAAGLVLFNRFYQPDLDIERLEVVPRVHLSSSEALRLPIRWIAILFGRIEADFALTSGVHTHEDVIKGLMAGANITMVASEILKNGIGRIPEMLIATSHWLEDHGYDSLRQCIGSMSQKHVAEPGAFERANYLRTLQSWPPKTQF
ncbi:MAG: dihydroorotate dehydrogenase-like protein [Rhodothermales bacterium]|nr:dihydroorotate dehydrogenase-like protein [Rhodothermales bacterium]